MTTSALPRALAALLVLCSACDLTTPWSGGSDPQPPGAFRVAVSTFDEVYLVWSNPGAGERPELEWRVGTGTWGPAPGHLLPEGAWYVPLDGVPELTTCTFRIRRVVSGRTSPWAETSAVRGVRAPTIGVAGASGAAFGPTIAPLTVTWSNRSLVATDVAVERQDGSAPGAPWVAIPGAALAAGSVLDDGVAEGGTYRYRVRAGASGVWSDGAEAAAGPIALFAPADLSAEVVTTGVHLSWTSRSTSATRTTVHAEGPLATPHLAVLPPSARAWLHADAVWPVTRYNVVSWRGDAWASSEWATLPPFRIEAPVTLDASAIALPGGFHYARAPDGSFHVASGARVANPVVHRATAEGHEPHPLVRYAPRLLEPGVLVDAAGHPHVLYEDASGSRELVHEAWNGARWDSEVVGTAPPLPIGRWGLGPGGAVHVAYGGEPHGEAVHLVRAGGVSAETRFGPDPAPGFYLSGFAFATGPDGTAVLARTGTASVPGGRVLIVATRTADGTWATESVPVGAGLITNVAVAAGSAGHAAVAYTVIGTSTGELALYVARRSGGSWSDPELVSPGPRSYQDLAIAASPDLATIVLSAPRDATLAEWDSSGWMSRTELFVRRGDAWHVVALGPGRPSAFVGVTAEGRSWALCTTGAGDDPWGEGRFSLFTEPPP